MLSDVDLTGLEVGRYMDMRYHDISSANRIVDKITLLKEKHEEKQRANDNMNETFFLVDRKASWQLLSVFAATSQIMETIGHPV